MPNSASPTAQPWFDDPLPAGLVWLEEPSNSFSAIFASLQDDFFDAPLPAPVVDKVVAMVDVDIDTYRARLETLRIWAQRWDIDLEMRSSMTLAGGSSAWTRFKVHPRGNPIPPYRKLVFGESSCSRCGCVNIQGTALCAECNGWLGCEACLHITLPTIIDDEHRWCLGCTNRCRTCDIPISPDWDSCSQHGIRVCCDSCGSADQVEMYEGVPVCSYCLEARCVRCVRRRHDEYWDEDEGGYLCRRCYEESRFGDFGENAETLDVDAQVDDFTMPTIPGRELIRHCGIEIEGGGTPNNIIVPLREAGLTQQIAFNGYHFMSSHTPGTVRDWSVEHDGSVDWELVSPRLNMADPTDVLALDRAVRTLRDAVHSEQVTLDMRCGLHIHVSAARIPVGGAYKLKGYWDYLEDVMFRLGSANWPFHRAVMNGGEYTRNTPKTGMSDKLDFARHYERNNDRYYALSFANYFRAFMENCSCGAARYDTWDNCTCDLGKCTFEFRVFNTSANPTKIHAYLALCQALVAKAADGEDITNIQADLPPMSFDPIIFEKASDSQKSALLVDWQPRLRWIFNELPLTDAEKRSVMYCVEKSELNNLDRNFIRSLNPDQFAMEVGA